MIEATTGTLGTLHTFEDPKHAGFSAVLRSFEVGMYDASGKRCLLGYRRYEALLDQFIADEPSGSPFHQAAVLMEASTFKHTSCGIEIDGHSKAVKSLIETMQLKGEVADLIRHAGLLLYVYSATPEEAERPMATAKQQLAVKNEFLRQNRRAAYDRDTARRNRQRGARNVLTVAVGNTENCDMKPTLSSTLRVLKEKGRKHSRRRRV